MTVLQNKEYELLFDEINQKVALHNTLLTFALTTSVTIIASTYALGSAPKEMLLVPFCILIPMSMRIAYYRNAMARIAAYMIVFLESGDENDMKSMHWETRLKRSAELGGKVENQLKSEFEQEKEQAAIEALGYKDWKILEKRRRYMPQADKAKIKKIKSRVNREKFNEWREDLDLPRNLECLSLGTVCSVLYVARCLMSANCTKITDYLVIVLEVVFAGGLAGILAWIAIRCNSMKRQKQMWIKRWTFIKNEELTCHHK